MYIYDETANKYDERSSVDYGLLPCPFCGGEAMVEFSNDNSHKPYVVCKYGTMLEPKCSASIMYACQFETIEEAVEAWNRRF